ncbi:MAG: hypothetical protein KC619_14330 [Myxococcales bacterium]|nr:hypothetical protein [Myxococcales bacterium]
MYPNIGPTPSPTPGVPPAPVAQPIPPSPPPPRRPPWLLLILGSFGSGGVTAVVVALVMYFSADIRDRTHAFLADLRTGSDADAWAMTTPSFQERVPREAMPGWIDQRVPSVRRSTGEWINGFSGGGDGWCMEVWLHGDGLEVSTVYVILREVDDVWRVDEITYDELPMCESDD